MARCCGPPFRAPFGVLKRKCRFRANPLLGFESRLVLFDLGG